MQWKEVFFFRCKPDVRVAIRRFNFGVVISHNKLMVRLRADRGSNFTCKEFRDICTELVIRVVFATMETPLQIRVSECDECTLIERICCLPFGRGLLSSLHVGRADSNGNKPYESLSTLCDEREDTVYDAFWKGTGLQQASNDKVRTFVHPEIYSPKLKPKT